MKPNIKEVAVHLICCLLFLAMPYIFAPGPHNSWQSVLNVFTLRELISYLMLIGFFYLNYLVLIPRFYFTEKYLPFIALCLVSFLAISIIPNLLVAGGFHFDLFQPPPPPAGFDHGPGDHGHGGSHRFNAFDLFHNLFIFLVVLFVSLILRINGRLKQAEQEKVTAELSYLKAQINPHFLFNTLNSIYSLAIENSDYTATAIVKLAGMMRYILSDAGKNFVSLDKEINYISDYIELQKVRFANTFQLTYNLTGSAVGKNIAPLVLMPFIENAFKHGVNPEEESVILINIAIEPAGIKMKVHNKKVSVSATDMADGGLGINNTRNRLQLIYPGRHMLEITDTAQIFEVNLTIQLP